MIDLKNIPLCEDVLHSIGTSPVGRFPICSDTRAYAGPALFLAFPGARYNPIDKLAEVLAKGCPAVIYQVTHEDEQKARLMAQAFPQTTFFGVRDVVRFTQELALRHVTQWRQESGGLVFAISGSNGKTTHKEMLFHLLDAAMPKAVVATEKNHNNHLGVPLTLLRIAPETKICVLELGSNHPGEIKVLCDLARPEAGLVTNIGATHLEFFGTEEAVFHEEGFLASALTRGPFFKNIDDKFLATLAPQVPVLTFSRERAADLRFEIAGSSVRVISTDGEVVLSNEALTGAHNFANLATAWGIASVLFPRLRDEFTRAASSFRPTPNRSEWRRFSDRDVYLDAYNANPSSMKVAVVGFFEKLARLSVGEADALLVLGDMNELGERAPEYHAEVGEFLRRWPRAKYIFVGRFAQSYVKGLGAGNCYSTVMELAPEFIKMTRGATHVFIKGSRSLQLESLLAIT